MYTTKEWKKFYNKQTKINAKICKLIAKRDENYRKYYEEHGKEWLEKNFSGDIPKDEPYLSGDYNQGEEKKCPECNNEWSKHSTLFDGSPLCPSPIKERVEKVLAKWDSIDWSAKNPYEKLVEGQDQLNKEEYEYARKSGMIKGEPAYGLLSWE